MKDRRKSTKTHQATLSIAVISVIINIFIGYKVIPIENRLDDYHKESMRYIMECKNDIADLQKEYTSSFDKFKDQVFAWLRNNHTKL